MPEHPDPTNPNFAAFIHQARVAVKAYRDVIEAEQEWENRNPAEPFGPTGFLSITEKSGKAQADLTKALEAMSAFAGPLPGPLAGFHPHPFADTPDTTPDTTPDPASDEVA